MIEGSCLCGGIRYRAEASGPMAHCHCGMCRKAHGSAFSTLLPVASETFRWVAGEELLSHFESSAGKRRWFCSRCGSQLASTREGAGGNVLLRAGCIDSGFEGRAVAHGWVSSKASWHEITDALARFEEGFPGAPPVVSRGAEEREAEPDAAAVRVFPPAVPLLAVLLGVALEWLWPLGLGSLLPASLRYGAGVLVIAGAVLGLGLPAVLLFRRGGQDENPWKPTPHLEARGPFRWTRNPMYLQMVLLCVGFAILLGNVWILVLTPAAGWALQRLAILPEEAYLERRFGDDYRAYKRRVRRWL